MPRVKDIAALLLVVTASAWAQQPPPKLEPLPEPPPPPPGMELDSEIEPQVTIVRKGEDTVEEYRVNGMLYKVVVTPLHGVPYTLIDPKGDGNLIPLDNAGGQRISVPLWEIGTF